MQSSDLIQKIIAETRDLDATPARYRHDEISGDRRDELLGLADQVLAKVWEVHSRSKGSKSREEEKTALDRDVYKELLGPETPKPSNTDRLIPHRQDEEVVQSELQKIAEQTAQALVDEAEKEGTPSIDAIQRGIHALLNLALRRRLEEIGETDNFHLGGKIWASTQDIKKTFKKVRDKVNEHRVSKREAVVLGLFNMGAITIEEIQKRSRRKKGVTHASRDFFDYEHGELANEVEESLRWAEQYVSHLAGNLQAKITQAMANDELNVEYDGAQLPDTNSSLRTYGAYELLEYLFEKGQDTRDYNDAQILLNFFLAHWTYQRFIEKKMTRTLSDIDKGIVKILKKDRSGRPVLASGRQAVLRYENGEFKMSRVSAGSELKIVEVNGTEYPMYYEDMSEKEDESAINKLFKGRKKIRVEDIPDLARTRMVAWTVTSDEMTGNERVRQDMEAVLTRVAGQLGLKLDEAFTQERKNDSDCSIETLKKGYFIIERPSEDDPFPKFSIQARLKNGVPFEFQILPFDLHCLEAVKGSGIAHDEYKAMLQREIERKAVPRSMSPVTHAVLDLEEMKSKKLRSETRAAMKKEELKQAFRGFMSRDNFITKKAA